MTNERTMEHWVLKDLGIDLTKEEHEEYWIYPQGNSKDPLVNRILKKCGGKPKICPLDEFIKGSKNSKGQPEYIFRSKKTATVLLVECKTKIADHQSERLDKPAAYNWWIAILCQIF